MYQGWYEWHLTEVKQYEVGFNRTDLRNGTVLTHYVETVGNETYIDLGLSDKIEQYSSYEFKVRARTPWGWGPWSERTEQVVETGIFGHINVTRDDGRVSSSCQPQPIIALCLSTWERGKETPFCNCADLLPVAPDPAGCQR